MPCSIERLKNGMVYQFKNSPRTVGWANATSPILDVTDIVKQVYPEVTEARLTIYGDPNRVRVIYKSATKPPNQTVDQIVRNWMNGVEVERQYCPDDKLYYLVQYPARLQLKKSGSSDETLKLLAGAAVIVALISALKR